MPTVARLGLGAADDAAPVDAMSATPRPGRIARDELSMLPVVSEQARALTNLGDRPLVVLTSTENAGDIDGWAEAQEHLAELSSVAVTFEVAASHGDIVEDPGGAAASVQAVTSVVRAYCTGTSLTTR